MAAEVPHVGSDDATGRCDPRELGQAGNRVGHEVDHQLGQDEVERAVVVWQFLHGGRPPLEGLDLAATGDEVA